MNGLFGVAVFIKLLAGEHAAIFKIGFNLNLAVGMIADAETFAHIVDELCFFPDDALFIIDCIQPLKLALSVDCLGLFGPVIIIGREKALADINRMKNSAFSTPFS